MTALDGSSSGLPECRGEDEGGVPASRITGTSGNSTSYLGIQKAVAKIFDQFIAFDGFTSESGERTNHPFPGLGGLLGRSDKLISLEHATNRMVWQHFADFLVYHYIIPMGKKKGQPLGVQSAIYYLNTAMQLASKVHPGCAFFLCTDKNVSVDHNEDRKWLENVRQNMWKICFARAVENGDKIDEAATPLYLEHVEAILRAYARSTSLSDDQAKRAHRRKLSVLSLWQVAGRSGEIATLSYNKLEWDEHFKCVFVEVNQLKTTKTKKVVFSAGAHRHLCWFTAFGDRLCSESVSDKKPDEIGTTWLFPDLCDLYSPGTKIGDYIKALLPSAGKAKCYALKDYAVKTLPVDINAASIRRGCCNTLHSEMPEAFAIAVTGHKLESNAHQQYIDASTANAMPGAVVLTGFPSLPWGQRGKCGVPATLDALSDAALTDGGFEKIIDEFYSLGDSSEPALSRGGALRPAVRAAFASQVMYYRERQKSGECRDVCKALQYVLKHTGNAVDLIAADQHLLHWSSALAARFQKDNRHLTMRHQADLVTQVRTMIGAVEEKQDTNATELHELKLTVDALRHENRALLTSVQQLTEAFNQFSRQQHQHQGELFGIAKAWSSQPAGGSPAAEAVGADANPSSIDPPPVTVVQAPVVQAPVLEVVDLQATAGSPQPKDVTDFMMNAAKGSEPGKGGDPLPEYAKDLFMNAWKSGKGGSEPEGLDRKRAMEARYALGLYNAMLTEEDKRLLQRPEDANTRGQAADIAEKVESMVVQYLREQFMKHFGELPPMLKRPSSKKRRRGYADPLGASAPTYMRNTLFKRGFGSHRGLGDRAQDIFFSDTVKKWAEWHRSGRPERGVPDDETGEEVEMAERPTPSLSNRVGGITRWLRKSTSSVSASALTLPD